MTPKLVLTMFFATVLFALNCREENTHVPSAKNGKLYSTLTETGELQAADSKIISVPRIKWEYTNNGRTKVLWLEKEGLRVARGDIIAKLDTSGIERVKSQKEADLDIAKADLEKLKVDNLSKLKALEADYLSAQAAFKLAQIDTQRVRYESKAKKEINDLNLKIARIESKKVQNKIKHAQVIQTEELLIQREKIKQIISAIENASLTIKKFTLRAPADGMIEYRKTRWGRGPKVRVGDEIRQGRPIIGLPDLSAMKVKTTVNETDIGKIYVGQKAIVRLDAYPKVAFDAHIQSIGITSHEKEEKSKIKVFDVELLVDKADPILKPGMTVSCEILLDMT